MRYAVINDSTGEVANIIQLDDPEAWSPPDGHHLHDEPGVGNIGDTWNDGTATFLPPPEPAPPLRQFTPREVLLGFYAMIGEANTHAQIDAMTRRQREEYRSASLIDENDPKLLAQLQAAGKTIDDLKAAVAGL